MGDVVLLPPHLREYPAPALPDGFGPRLTEIVRTLYENGHSSESPEEPIIIGSAALHHYMQQTEGATPNWRPDDLDVAVWTRRSQVREHLQRYREAFPEAKVTRVSFNRGLLERDPSLQAWAQDPEMDAIRARVIPQLAQQCARMHGLAYVLDRAEDHYLAKAAELDEQIHFLERVVTDYEAFQQLRTERREEFAELLGKQCPLTRSEEQFDDVVMWVLTLHFPSYPRKVQLVGIYPTIGFCMSECLERITDKPASVRMRFADNPVCSRIRFMMDERTREVIRTRTALSTEVCASRREKYEARGWRYLEEAAEAEQMEQIE